MEDKARGVREQPTLHRKGIYLGEMPESQGLEPPSQGVGDRSPRRLARGGVDMRLLQVMPAYMTCPSENSGGDCSMSQEGGGSEQAIGEKRR